MENRSMSNFSTDANFQAHVVDDKSEVRDLVSSVLRCNRAFTEVMNQVARVADSDLPVLLTGEPGTGKELVASAIHNRSSRRDQPFVTVNCGAIPPESIEEKLFGQAEDRRGFFEDADGGTIFLDDITETTPSLQERLLTVLQTGEIRRVGSNQVQQISLRVIAASNHNVEQDVAAGRFCNDLFNHLSAVSIVLPPSREQGEGDRSLVTDSVNDDWVTLSVIEGRYVARVLEHTGGNKQAAARLMAVDRKTLDRMIKRHHIDSHHLKALRAKAFSRS